MFRKESTRTTNQSLLRKNNAEKGLLAPLQLVSIDSFTGKLKHFYAKKCAFKERHAPIRLGEIKHYRKSWRCGIAAPPSATVLPSDAPFSQSYLLLPSEKLSEPPPRTPLGIKSRHLSRKRKRYKYHRIITELHRRGLHINHKAVQSLMKKRGLNCLVLPGKRCGYIREKEKRLRRIC